jgi:hypothetical protein
MQTKDIQFIIHTKDSDWETLAQRWTIVRLCALLKSTLGGMDMETYTLQVSKAFLFE